MPKRHLIGTITSVKMHETALVNVDSMKRHPLYGKRYRRSQTFAAHNPANTYQMGDRVEIEEHRPISKTKHWLIRRRIEAGQIAAEMALEPELNTVLGEGESSQLNEEIDQETEA